MTPKQNSKTADEKPISRNEHRMRLFVETYLKSLNLHKVDASTTAEAAVKKFDELFPE